MSVTIAGSSVRASKAVCIDCNRTIYIVTTLDGQKLATDPELLAFVPRGGKERVVGHRIHGELCDRYKIEAERERFRAEQKSAIAAAKKVERVERSAKHALVVAAREAARSAPKKLTLPILRGSRGIV